MEQEKYYRNNGKKYDRVTAILSIINTGLQYIPKQILKNAADRGTYFHKLCQNFNVAVKNKMLKSRQWKKYCKQLDDTYTDDDYQIRHDYELYQNWIIDNNIEILECEKTYYDDKLMIAGKIDLLVNWQKKIYLCDIKYVNNISHLADLQTVGYQHLLLQNKIKSNRIILGCKNTKHKLYPMILKNDDDDYGCFLAALRLYRRFGGNNVNLQLAL